MTAERDEKDTQADGLERAALSGAAVENVQRFGSAVKEHFVAFSGVDNEAGKNLKKSLDKIFNYKASSEGNIKQQAGFAAEVKSVARQNAKNIINKKLERVVRTDDLGRVNDQIMDLVEVDANGNEILGTGAQLKFAGQDPKDLLDNTFCGKKGQKYLDADVLLGVADDDYAALIGSNSRPGLIDKEIAKCENELKHTTESGKIKEAEGIKAKIAKLKKIKKNLRKTGLTREEAIEARLHPELSTAKDVVRVAHRAGMEQAKYGALIAGSASIIRNARDFFQGKKTLGEAAMSTAVDTGSGAAASYVTSFAGSTIKGFLQNSSSAVARGVSKTALPAAIVTSVISIGKSVHRYVKGYISGTECLGEIAQDGVGTLGSIMFATMGVAALPAGAPALIGAFTGLGAAMVGYAIATSVYKELSSALKSAKLAHEQRIIVEQRCAESIRMIKEYRKEMEEMVSNYLSDHIKTFNACFASMDEAIIANDVDGFIKGNSELQKVLGRKPQFNSFNEFDALMNSDEPFKL